VIDPAVADAFARIGARQQDLLDAFRPGFEPRANDAAARAPQRVPSLDPLSVVAPEGAYFVSAGPDGKVRLSRDGSFRFAGGELRAADGALALGFPLGERRGAPVPLRVDPVDAALGRVADPRISADGTVSYLRTTVDPRGAERRSERVALGRLVLARLPAGTQPVRLDATHVAAPAGVAPLAGVPADGTFPPLVTNASDLGRVDPAAGLQRLQEAYLAFEALQAAHRARGGTEQTTLDLVK
jgi:flagellar basal body rod protein FlgG